MRWQLTSHAVDRYIDRIGPGLSYAMADQEIRQALGTAKRDREAERNPRLRGQVYAATPHGRVLTHFVVLPPSDPTTCGRSIVTTCWPSDFAGDEIAELQAAERDALHNAPRRPTSSAVVLPRDDAGWGQLVGRIEVARM